MNVVHPARKKQKLFKRFADHYHNGFKSPVDPLLGPSKSECLVFGALAMTLRLSRVMGAAPLRFKRVRNGWRPSLSRPCYIYSLCLMIIMNFSFGYPFVVDFILNDPRLVVGSLVSAVLVGVRMSSSMSLVTICTATAPRRMTQMIEYLNIINKIHIKYSRGGVWQPVQTKKHYIMAAVLIVMNISYITPFIIRCVYYLGVNKNVFITVLFVLGRTERIHASLIEAQFLYIGMLLEAAFEKINDSLQGLVDVVDDERPHTLKKMKDVINDLASTYGEACNVLTKVTHSFGRDLLLLLSNMFQELVIVPYFLYALIQKPDSHSFSIFVYTVNFLCNFANVVLITEPGHGIQAQMNQTKVILSKLLRHLNPDNPLRIQLHFFFKQLCQTNAPFSALGVCTLTRPFVLSIIGGVTTYLVIILQFVALDTSNTYVIQA